MTFWQLSITTILKTNCRRKFKGPLTSLFESCRKVSQILITLRQGLDGFSGSTDGSSLPQHILLSAVSFLLCPSQSPISAILTFGFSVLTLKKKYNRWHTHTIAIQILPIGTFFIQIKPISITTVTIPIILHFVPIVMALF